jgi:hypothetical protein
MSKFSLTNSWKTTITGILAILVAAGGAAVKLLDGDAATNPDWEVVMAAIMAGLGLIFARDNNVSSKDIGL